MMGSRGATGAVGSATLLAAHLQGFTSAQQGTGSDQESQPPVYGDAGWRPAGRRSTERLPGHFGNQRQGEHEQEGKA